MASIPHIRILRRLSLLGLFATALSCGSVSGSHPDASGAGGTGGQTPPADGGAGTGGSAAGAGGSGAGATDGGGSTADGGLRLRGHIASVSAGAPPVAATVRLASQSLSATVVRTCGVSTCFSGGIQP